eukprot:Nk52_evm35s78 gene=Nk52_evmTU35s78
MDKDHKSELIKHDQLEKEEEAARMEEEREEATETMQPLKKSKKEKKKHKGKKKEKGDKKKPLDIDYDDVESSVLSSVYDYEGNPYAGTSDSYAELRRDHSRNLESGEEFVEEEEYNENAAKYIYSVILFSSLGGILFGYGIGATGGTLLMKDFQKEFDISDVFCEIPGGINSASAGNGTSIDSENLEIEDKSCVSTSFAQSAALFVGIYMLGSWLMSLFTARISDKFGRKYTSFAFAIADLCGMAIQLFAPNFPVLLVGRFLAGVGIGVLSLSSPMLFSELSPRYLKGRLVTLQQLSIALGIVIAFLVNFGVESYENGWRYSIGGQFCICALFACGIAFLPESPRWFMKKGREDDAAVILATIRPDPISTELKELKVMTEYEQRIGTGTWGDLFKKELWLKVSTGSCLQVFQHLSGISCVLNYSLIIMSVWSITVPYAYNIALGLSHLVGAIVSVVIMDRVGRKTMLILGSFMLFMPVLLSTVALYMGFDYGFVCCLALSCFLFFFSLSWGPLSWVIPSEIYPLKYRSKAFAVTSFFNWAANTFVCVSTIFALSFFGTKVFYIIWCGCLINNVLFAVFSVPETKGVDSTLLDAAFTVDSLSSYLNYIKFCFGCCFVLPVEEPASETDREERDDIEEESEG